MMCSHVAFVLLAHHTTTHTISSHTTTTLTVWLHVVHEHVCPSPDYSPPVKTDESGDEDHNSITNCKRNNGSRLDLFLILCSLSVILIGIVVVTSWVARISIWAHTILTGILTNLLVLVIVLWLVRSIWIAS